MDIYNSNITKNKQYGAGVQVGVDSKNNNSVSPPMLTLIYQNQRTEQEGITKATIGNGDITIGVTGYTRDANGNIIGVVGGTTISEDNGNNIDNNSNNNNSNLISGLNRDVNNSDIMGQVIKTNAIDWKLKIDGRMFTKEGIGEIKTDFMNLGGNLTQATQNMIDTLKSGTELTREQYDNLKNIISSTFEKEIKEKDTEIEKVKCLIN